MNPPTLRTFNYDRDTLPESAQPLKEDDMIKFWVEIQNPTRGSQTLTAATALAGRLGAAVLVSLFYGLTANAQTFRGTINGTVTDPSGAFVPGASVKATEKATCIVHNSVTTTEGQFAFQDIQPGFY